jgi:hypothetical protein
MITSLHLSRFTISKLQVTISKLQVTSYKLHFTLYKLENLKISHRQNLSCRWSQNPETNSQDIIFYI